MARTSKAVKAVPATAGINKQGGQEMEILGNTVVVGKEQEGTRTDGSKYYFRPILINGLEDKKVRLYRTVDIRPIRGKNVEKLLGWFPGKEKTNKKYKQKISLWGLEKKDIITRVGKNGAYETVEVKNQPKGVQIGAFPSVFNADELRVEINVYPDYQD